MHSRVGSFEWSGELITTEKGSINDLDYWEITAEDIFLADVGSSGFTGYEVDKGAFKSSDVVELYEKFPGLLEGKQKVHHIHSHHNMRAFFSGTDWENLEDRASVSNYFLMLIVNFEGVWCAKVAFKAKRKGKPETKLEFSNNTDGFKDLVLNKGKDEEVLVVMDCSIELQVGEMAEDFVKRFEDVKASLEAEQKAKIEANKQKYKSNFEKGGSHQGWKQHGLWKEEEQYGDAYDYVGGKWQQIEKKKRVSEMTDKEWKEYEGDGQERFTLKHAKCYLNSILDGTFSGYDFSDCIGKIEECGKELLTDRQLEEYITEFEELLPEHFDQIFIGRTTMAYVDLLEVLVEYLRPYSFRNNLIREMITSVEDEIRLAGALADEEAAEELISTLK